MYTLPKLQKLNTTGATHLIALLFVVVGAGIIGSYLLVASHADTPSATLVTSNAATKSATSNTVAILTAADAVGLTGAPSSVPYSYVGTQTVDFLPPGASLAYDQGAKGNVTACYEVFVTPPKTGTATATVEFANNNNYVTTTLSSNTTNNLQEVCVAPGTKTNPGFAVKNLTPSSETTNIEVYQATLKW